MAEERPPFGEVSWAAELVSEHLDNDGSAAMNQNRKASVKMLILKTVDADVGRTGVCWGRDSEEGKNGVSSRRVERFERVEVEE